MEYDFALLRLNLDPTRIDVGVAMECCDDLVLDILGQCPRFDRYPAGYRDNSN